MRTATARRTLPVVPAALGLTLAVLTLVLLYAPGGRTATVGARSAPDERLAPRAPVTTTYTATPDLVATGVAGTMTALAPTITPSPPPRTATPGPTATPRPVLLPVTLRDPACRPEATYSDVVFVEDVSKYMTKMHDGKESRAWSAQWMKQLVGLMDLAHARMGLVRFTDDVWVEQNLTNNITLLRAAIDRAPAYSRDKARMDHGLRVARDLLLSRASTPGNRKVIVFISELQAKSVPWENVPGCVEERGEECAVMAAADEVKRQGITIYVWATSTTADGGQYLWARLATDTTKRYLLPTDADIATTLGEIQVVKACPPEGFWPYPPRR